MIPPKYDTKQVPHSIRNVEVICLLVKFEGISSPLVHQEEILQIILRLKFEN